MAWLHATLDRVEGDKPDAKQETRLEGLRRNWKPDQEWLDMVSQQTYETFRDNWMPELPPVEFGKHLVEILMKRGPVMSGAMGPVPMSDVDLRAYQDNSGVELQPWEVDFLLRLSQEYLAESQKASRHFAPAPWQPENE